jgi:hypothetical protein
MATEGGGFHVAPAAINTDGILITPGLPCLALDDAALAA